jgi:tRNA 2-thiouridine synthesizing protein D
MMKISILVTSPPIDSSAPQVAIDYCQSIIASGGHIDQVFFYQAGVYNATGLVPIGADKSKIRQGWLELAEKYAIPLLVCVTAANKRGIIDSQEAEQQGVQSYSLLPPFQQVGLGEFFTLLHNSEGLVQF